MSEVLLCITLPEWIALKLDVDYCFFPYKIQQEVFVYRIPETSPDHVDFVIM